MKSIRHMREHEPHYQYEPTPRYAYEGDVYPPTGQRVVRMDLAGYRAARKNIAKRSPRHPSLSDASLWPREVLENVGK